MDYLKIPLVFEKGRFQRAPVEEALQRYVALFFAARKYEAAPALDFGLAPEDLGWISGEAYLRALVDEFNRFHQGQLALMIEGREARGGDARVQLTLRRGHERFRLAMALGNLLPG